MNVSVLFGGQLHQTTAAAGSKASESRVEAPFDVGRLPEMKGGR